VVSMLFFFAIIFLQVATSWVTIINNIDVIKLIIVRSFYMSFYIELPLIVFICTIQEVIRICENKKT
jgi:hypothetical protein